jgi:hypothetical protein
MKLRTMWSVAAVAALLVFVVTFSAWADDWVLLGTRTVALSADRDVINVGSGEGLFKALRLTVRDKGVQFERIVVEFRNGRTVETAFHEFVAAGVTTRAFNLPGRDRIIRKIVFYYTTRPGTLDRAVVEAWGLRE